MSQVALSIYELHGTSALNLLTRAADMGGQCAESCLGHMWSFLEGAYHVGVEAADRLWNVAVSAACAFDS